MKKLLIVLLSALSLASCVKDDGNYDYTPIKPVTITGIQSSYRVFLQSTLTIPVTLTTEIADGDLTYTWLMEADTLSRSKDLTYTFTKETAAAHTLTFEAKNTKNNVRYTKTVTLTIVSPFQTGWAFLTEKNNQATLNFLSYEGTGELYKDLYQTVNGEALGTGAVTVKHLLDYNVNRMSVICSTGKSVELDGSSMVRVKYYSEDFRGTDFEPLAINSERLSEDRFLFIISKGKIYAKGTGAAGTDDTYFQYPLEGDERGYLAGNFYTKGSSSDYYMTYDRLNKRYLRFQVRSLSRPLTPLPLVTTSAAAFDPSNVDGESIWMGQSSARKALSIIKTPAGKYVLHVLNSQYLNGDVQWSADAAYTFPDGAITATSCFVAHGTNPYLMIGTGKNLKALNLDGLSQGATALNAIATYDSEITAMNYTYDINKNINEFGIALNTGDPEFPGSFILVNTSLTSNGAILRRVDKIGGVVKSMVRKVQ